MPPLQVSHVLKYILLYDNSVYTVHFHHLDRTMVLPVRLDILLYVPQKKEKKTQQKTPRDNILIHS